MKPLLCMICGCLIAALSNATIIIVDNNPNSPALYNNLQAAINAASPGDTIYIQGSNTNYMPGGGTIHINKKLTIIGTGHNPQKQNALKSMVGASFIFEPGSSGSALIGITTPPTGIGIQTSGASVDSLYIADNYINLIIISGSNHIIEENIKTNNAFTINSGSNIIIRNNIIAGAIDNANQPTVEIANNVFIDNIPAFINVSNVMIRNNIFYKTNPTGTTSATFINNITYQTTNTLPTPGNFGSGNINNTDPEFVNVPVAATTFSYSYDYNLQSTSPGIGAGSDGTDIGLYGGLGNFKMTGEPPIPIIREFTISNPTIPTGSNIDVKVVSETAD